MYLTLRHPSGLLGLVTCTPALLPPPAWVKLRKTKENLRTAKIQLGNELVISQS